MIRYAGLEEQSVSDGPGIRLTVFLQGCLHSCPGCHNPQLQDIAGGTEMEEKELAEFLLSKLTILHSGITFSGGDPLLQAEGLTKVLGYLKAVRPELNIWVYTGYLYEEVKDLVLMELIDVLVDGLYLEAERDLSLAFRGSGNQRIIDIKQSRLRNEPVIWRSKYDF